MLVFCLVVSLIIVIVSHAVECRTTYKLRDQVDNLELTVEEYRDKHRKLTETVQEERKRNCQAHTRLQQLSSFANADLNINLKEYFKC